MAVAAPVLEANPLREGLEQERVPDASCLVIFGASGDLTQRKLIPALYSLAHDGLLPAGQTIIGYARPDYTDDAFRWFLRRLLNLIPDVSRYDLHTYVAHGFDIPWIGVLFVDNFLTLLGYLLPWGIMAFYLMKFREIANPT